MSANPAIPSRDFIGYGQTPPDPKWPGGARIAVNFCMNYEEGGERSILNGDAHNEIRISDVLVDPRPGRRELSIEQCYEYGARVGYWRIIEAFRNRGLPATINLVGVAAEKNEVCLRAMLEMGWDIQLHGWKWIDFDTLSEAEEREMIRIAINQAETFTGKKPLGYYAGMPSLNTRRLVVEAGSFLYDSDCYNDDLPYWSPDDPGLLLIPYSLDTNDSKFARAEHAYVTADQWATYVCDTFDQLYAEGADHPKMMTLGLHARLLGRPGRIKALHMIMDHMMKHQHVWFAKREDIALHWQKVHPDPRVG